MDGGPVRGKDEYTVKRTKATKKKLHVMRFKPPHKCNLEELVNPTLERQTVVKMEHEGMPETGEGSEYGRKRREEARKRRRGYRLRTLDPDDQPWILREKKKGGKHFVGRKEGTVSAGSSYFVFTIGHDGTFEASPVDNWYDFVPPVKYNFLDADEAEERFEQRNKTLNYFSIMLSKKLKDSEDGDEDGAGGSDGKEARSKEKKKAADSGLLLTDSDSGEFSSDDESDEGSPVSAEGNKGSQATSKKEKNKKTQKKKNRRQEEDLEAGEDTDEGEMESREMDYTTDSSSNSEQDFQERQTQKDLPKDDEEVERKEQGEIDKGFMESSSSEDELTDKGKELKELMKKMSGDKKEPDLVAEEEEKEMQDSEAATSKQENSKSGHPKPTGKSPVTDSTVKTSKTDRKRDRGNSVEKNKPESSQLDSKTASPPSKKHKAEFSPSTITEEEVKRYLQRRPIASKDLVRKFINKKSGMERHKIVEVLHTIIEKLPKVKKQMVKDKLYLSLISTDEK